MIPYILHVAVLLGCSYLLYKLLLGKETFFGLNRYLLVAAIVLSFSLPYYEIPEKWSFWEDAPSFVQNETDEIPALSEAITITSNEPQNLEEEQAIVPSHEASKHFEDDPKQSKWTLHAISIPQVLWIIYVLGVLIFTIHFLIQIATLAYKIIRLPSLKDGRYRIVELDQDEPPYSFLNCIFINPEKYDWETYNQIIAHEKIHIQQLHSFDMILAELVVILQWFNPVAWQYRKMIESNLEYLTDQNMLAQGVQREVYQLNLLKVSVPQYPIGLAMNYNQSTLKKRIKMMNAKKSSVRSSWKYLAVLPALSLSTIFLNSPKAQVAEQEVSTNISVEAVIPTVEKASTVATMVEEQVVQQVTSVIAQEITLESQPDVDEQMNLEEAYQHINIQMSDQETFDASFEMKGFWQAQIENSQVCVRFDNSNLQKGNVWMTTACFDPKAFDQPLQGKGTFTINRTAGKAILVGEMQDDYGQGRYTFEGSKAFEQYLNKKGIEDVDDKYLFHLFTADITPAYFDYLKKEGFTNVSRKQLRNLAIHRLDMAYMKEMLPVFRSKGFTDVTVNELVHLKIHNVDKDYIEAMASIGFDDLSLEMLKKGKIHNVDVDYVKEIRAMGYDNLSFKDFIDFSIHNVDEDLVESLADMGFKDLPAKKLKSASIHNVSARYIKDLKAAGYDLKDIDDLIKFKIHNVDADFIARMNQLGYPDLSAQEITSAAIHNVNIEDVEAMRKMGYKDMTIKQVINMSIHNVDADYVKDLRDLGYRDLPINKVVNAKIHNLRPSFVQELNEMGFNNIPLQEAINLKIHNVTPAFIKRAQDKGMKDLSLSEYKKLKIHGILR